MVPEEWQQHQEIFLEMQIPGPTDQTLGGGVKGEGCEQVIQVIPTHAQFENQSLDGTCSFLHCDCELVKGRNVFIFVSSVFDLISSICNKLAKFNECVFGFRLTQFEYLIT